MINAAFIKNSFFQGIDLEDKNGRSYPDANLERDIAVAKEQYASTHGLLLKRSLVVIGNVPEGKLTSILLDEDLPLVRGGGIDYDPKSWHASRWAAMKLPYGPIVSTEDIAYVGLGVGYLAPQLLEFPKDWWQLTEKRFMLRLYPGWLNQQLISPYLFFGLDGSRRIPNAWRIAYRAGIDETSLLEADPRLAKMIALKAAINNLPMIAQMVAGQASSESVSVDGLSQSRSLPTSATSHALSGLQSSLEMQLKDLESHYFDRAQGGIRFMVI